MGGLHWPNSTRGFEKPKDECRKLKKFVQGEI